MEEMGRRSHPDSTGKKGDHLIGDFYVAFDRHFKEEVKEIMARENISEEEAKEKSPLMEEARGMPVDGSRGSRGARLWKMMNDWSMPASTRPTAVLVWTSTRYIT